MKSLRSFRHSAQSILLPNKNEIAMMMMTKACSSLTKFNTTTIITQQEEFKKANFSSNLKVLLAKPSSSINTNSSKMGSKPQQQHIGVSGHTIEGLVFSLAYAQQVPSTMIDIYSTSEDVKDEVCVLSHKSIELLNNYCGIDLSQSKNVTKLTHYHLIRADIRNALTVMDLKSITPPCLYSLQKSYLLKLLNDKLQKLSNVNIINDNIRNINENGNRISLSTKKSITKRHVDLLIAAEDDISQSQTIKYLQSKLGNELNIKSRQYECDTIILPSPSDIDYESRLFEWWNNSSRLAIIPLPNSQLGIHSIQYIPKHSALGMQRNSTNSLHFVNKIHANLRDNGVDSVIDVMRQYVYSRNRVNIIAHSQIAYQHELNHLFININNNTTSTSTTTTGMNNTSTTGGMNDKKMSGVPHIVAIGGVAHSVDPTLFQRANVAIHDAIQLSIQLNEHGLSEQALQLYEQDSKLSFDRINKYSEGMARIGFKKKVNKITILFKFVFEKLNIMRFKRIVSKVFNSLE